MEIGNFYQLIQDYTKFFFAIIYSGPSKLDTTVAIPVCGSGIFHNSFNLVKNGSQIKRVGMMANKSIGANLFIY